MVSYVCYVCVCVCVRTVTKVSVDLVIAGAPSELKEENKRLLERVDCLQKEKEAQAEELSESSAHRKAMEEELRQLTASLASEQDSKKVCECACV